MDSDRRRTAPPLGIQAALFALGVLLLLWLPLEDTSERPPLLLAMLTNTVLAMAYLSRSTASPCARILRRYLPVGVVAGLSVAPLAAFLMIFKGGLHGHGFLDYTIPQFVSILQRMPLWALIGALSGLGGGLWQWTRCE